ncbi:xanthine dehydrogenase small subunit [Vreelandella nigrificans]|uniref:Xanthine dehydrogenase small subunit n=1 Tax=Vreelandella nigrificans TaxID=2042704 RepID=A0A2A4HQZ4_9GAMM|nr:xanthine dehydrogenase small subunit [Halomonas nigrificans]PCF96523.1 xanthine dehydrogenase small subunit [Halomonas nigrificans]
MINFYLNGQPQRVAADAHLSVLELLREQLHLTGTKEGCASGDCGACTVAIGAPDATGELRYHSANACIMPAHQLQGCHLVTVEGLADGQERLHPAQTAMVECHGSQCGFCTPGIVMSLFTLHEEQHRHPAPLATAFSSERLEAALGGNLCRCTGYRPIRDAALAMNKIDGHRPAWLDKTWDDALDNQHPANQLAVDASHFHQPRRLGELVRLRAAHPEARLVAGGTDLWLEATQHLTDFPRVIDTTRVDELQRIEQGQDTDGRSGWWIGAAVTYARLEPLLKHEYPTFAHLLHRLGSAQVRNRGTLGGNVANASPIGDTPPVLLALDAQLRLAGPKGTREIAATDFFLDYKKTDLGADEVLSTIFIPEPQAGRPLKVWKLSKRREDDISAVLGAFAWHLEDGCLRDVRLAFGGMAGIPARARAAEAALEGCPPSPAVFESACKALTSDFSPMSDVRGSADYRSRSASALLERLRLVIASPTSPQAQTQEVMLHAYAH